MFLPTPATVKREIPPSRKKTREDFYRSSGKILRCRLSASRQSSSRDFESVTMLTPQNRLMFQDFYAGIEMETTNDTIWREN